MREETIAGFLDRLAARVPAPGGGAAAALHAAQAAALLCMVARYSDGPKYVQHADLVGGVLAAAEELRGRAWGLAAADAAAFAAVAEAYRLPKETGEQQAQRSATIATALAGAARPPADVIAAALHLVELAEELLPVANRSVVTDIAAAAEAARAAAATSRVNIEINLGGIKDPALRQEFTTAAALVDEIAGRADKVTTAVRQEIAR